MAATHAVPEAHEAHAPQALPFLFIVHVQLIVHFTKTLYHAVFNVVHVSTTKLL